MIFARHETFHPRFGWLKKGFDHVKKDPAIFYNKNEAHIHLGVGKNMANSIRYWLSAFGLMEEMENRAGYKTTPFANHLFGKKGWDPYLEDPASLWLLHYKLATNSEQATAWFYLFNEFNFRDFTTEEAVTALDFYARQQAPAKPIATSSIEKDINCILRMYLADPVGDKFIEDSLDSPFVTLDLIHKYPENYEKKKYVFNTGEKNSLPHEIIVALCLEYVRSTAEVAQTISLTKLTYGTLSPGLVCKITESEIEVAIEQVSAKHRNRSRNLRVASQAGVAHLTFEGSVEELYFEILQGYYGNGENRNYTEVEEEKQLKIAVNIQ